MPGLGPRDYTFMTNNKADLEMMARLMGIDLDAEIKRRQEEYVNYVHLLTTMTPEEVMLQVAEVFGADIKQCAIVAFLTARIVELEKR